MVSPLIKSERRESPTQREVGRGNRAGARIKKHAKKKNEGKSSRCGGVHHILLATAQVGRGARGGGLSGDTKK